MSKSTSETGEGGDALIHLRVPAALKAGWVRDSRAAGRKLTDWIVERVEVRPMNVFPISDALAAKYHGAGHALAAVTGGQVVELVYMADAMPDYDPDQRGALQTALSDDRLGPTVRRLQAVGQVIVGMCSAWEFIEL